MWCLLNLSLCFMFFIFIFFLCCSVFCVENSLCWLLFFLVFVLILSSLFDEKKILLFYFFSCFCFSHTKHQNPTERNWNQMQLVGSAFLPYKSVLVLNMLKPKFSVWCKNCLEHRPNRTKPITTLDFTLYTGALYEILYSQVVICVY